MENRKEFTNFIAAINKEALAHESFEIRRKSCTNIEELTNKLQQEKDLLHVNLVSLEEKLKVSNRNCVTAEKDKKVVSLIFIYNQVY